MRCHPNPNPNPNPNRNPICCLAQRKCDGPPCALQVAAEEAEIKLLLDQAHRGKDGSVCGGGMRESCLCTPVSALLPPHSCLCTPASALLPLHSCLCTPSLQPSAFPLHSLRPLSVLAQHSSLCPLSSCACQIPEEPATAAAAATGDADRCANQATSTWRYSALLSHTDPPPFEASGVKAR